MSEVNTSFICSFQSNLLHLLGDNLVVIVLTWFKDSVSRVYILVKVHTGLHVVYAYRLSPMVF